MESVGERGELTPVHTVHRYYAEVSSISRKIVFRKNYQGKYSEGLRKTAAGI